MRITYDRSVDAAYIYLVDSIVPGAVASTSLCEARGCGAQISLDFDASGRLLGIEVLAASCCLPQALLDQASPIEQDDGLTQG
jgi:uncharacterized protein YuzE